MNRMPGTAGREPDLAYRRALGRIAWSRLDPAVRRRFSTLPGEATPVVYRGVLRIVHLSLAGRLFAAACRLIGRPVTTRTGRAVPLEVELTRDTGRNGIRWRRTYRFAGNNLEKVVSTKCALGGNRFEEHVGRGFSMELTVAEKDGGLEFTSVAYRLRFAGLCIRVPHWMTPGTTTVTHLPLADGRFRFVLSVDHPLLGRTIYQAGVFQSAVRSL